MAMFYIEITILNVFPIEEVPVNPTDQFKKRMTVSMLQIVL